MRLVFEAKRIAEGNEPNIIVQGEEREYLMKIRREEITIIEVDRRIQEIISEIDKLKPWPLPDKGDELWLNNWLINMRKSCVKLCT